MAVTSTTKGAPWRLTPAPGITSKVKGSKAEKAAYDLAHRLWRAGLVVDFYFGKRSPSDHTVVWRLNGREYGKGQLADVVAELDRLMRAHHVTAVEWGARWCGFLAVEVTYDSGARACERYDAVSGRKVVETVDAVAVA